MEASMIYLILMAFQGAAFGKPEIELIPENLNNDYTNVHMYCEYNIPTGQRFQALIWYYNVDEIVYTYLTGGGGGPQGSLADRLTDMRVDEERHYMILNGTWCDNKGFKCTIVLIGENPIEDTAAISGNKSEYKVLLNGTQDVTSVSSVNQEYGQGFIQVTLLWNDQVILYVTYQNDEYDVAGTPTGSDICTHLAAINVTFDTEIGENVSYKIEADFGNVGSREFLHKLSVSRFLSPYSPEGFTLSNTTSQSVTLQWSPGFNGGAEQVFVLSGKTVDVTGYIKINSSIPDTNSKITYTPVGLEPDTKYNFKLTSKNAIGTSNPVNIYGETRVEPKVHDIKADVEDEDMIVTWTLERISTDEEYYIGIVVNYEDGDELKQYPEEGSEDATKQKLHIPGPFSKSTTIEMSMLIYEGTLGEHSVEIPFQYEGISDGLSGGEIAAIVISVIAAVAIAGGVVFYFTIYKKK